MLREDSAEAATTNNYRVEWARIALRTSVGPLGVFVGAVQRFIEAVTHESAKDIDGEVRQLGRLAGCHF